MEKMSAIILNIPNIENDFGICNISVCTCQQCEEDRQYEGGDDKSETSDESGEDEWLKDNVEVENRDNKLIYLMNLDNGGLMMRMGYMTQKVWHIVEIVAHLLCKVWHKIKDTV